MRVLWFGVVVALLFPGRMTVGAQEQLTISGQVVDITGAVLPGAAVLARRSSGAVAAFGVSDAAGRFVLQLSEPGDFRVSASLEGFSVTEIAVAVTGAAPPPRVELRLRPGGLAEELTVIGARLAGSEEMQRRLPGGFSGCS